MNANEKFADLLKSFGINCDHALIGPKSVLIRPTADSFDAAKSLLSNTKYFSSSEEKWNSFTEQKVLIGYWR